MISDPCQEMWAGRKAIHIENFDYRNKGRLQVLALLLVKFAFELHFGDPPKTPQQMLIRKEDNSSTLHWRSRITLKPSPSPSPYPATFNLASMDLASMYLCCSSCNFSSRPPRPSPSSTRLRLVELGLGLSGLEWSQRWSTSCNFSQVHLGQVEVQLGFASLDFNLASMDLIGVCGGSPRATPLKFNFGQVELETKSVKFNTNYR